MEEGRKRQGGEDAEVVAGKRARKPATSDETEKSGDFDQHITAWLSIDDEATTRLAKLLETETASTFPAKVRFIDDPYSLPLIFQSSSSYVTINGNDESCGSSFSDWESSVMASVDVGGISRFATADGGACGFDGEAVRGRAAREDQVGGECFEVKQIDGCDCFDIDDEMLARFIGEDLSE